MSDLDSTAGPLPAAPPMPGRFRLFWRSFAENKGAVLGLVVMIILVVLAIFADLVVPHSPIEQYRDAFLTPPVWQQGGSWNFILGTDDVGRDMFSRLIYGARLSLVIGVSVVSLSLTLGTVLGLTAAFSGGVVDTFIMRVMDILLVFPSLLLAIVIVAILGPGLFNAMLAVAITYLPGFTRLCRASALQELSREYVTATRCAGARRSYLMFNTVLPNCLAPLIVQASLSFSNAILDAAALGFLGLGAQPPTPEWGTMLAGALQYYQRAWWVLTFPGLFILVTVQAFNLFGDGLRDALDPKLKR
jgi:dipeptide transport system permease protein